MEQLAAGDAGPSDSAEDQDEQQGDAPELTDDEARLLRDWANVRLRPYLAQSVRKGQGMQVSDLLDERSYEVDDHAASRRVEPGEVLVAHLVPAGTRHYVAGAAAHLTEDTREKLREFAELHLEALRREQPDADLGRPDPRAFGDAEPLRDAAAGRGAQPDSARQYRHPDAHLAQAGRRVAGDRAEGRTNDKVRR